MKIFSYPSKAAAERVEAIAGRGLNFSKKNLAAVQKIINDVRKNGDEALLRYTRQFDAPKMTAAKLKVSEAEMAAAVKKVDRAFSRALNRAVRQIEGFHQKQLQKSWIDPARPGTLLGQLVNPVEAAGVYVPGAKGGQTPLVSTVLMGAIPAKIAGVERIVMVTPPTPEGTINPHLLVAAKKVGITDIYKIGSAWAIAALTYGTQTVPAVNIIVGPGNIYVTMAKQFVAGTVGIDMVAGPSEILIVADETANPDFIAADLLSQAEHDELASAVLVTTSNKVAEATLKALAGQLEKLSRREIAQKSIDRFGAIMVVPDLTAAFDLANRFAPEHLELQIENPWADLGRIRNAGAVFIGEYTPEPVGDYIAGPNHVLPTAGTARFASALGVDHFIKKTSLIHYSKDAFKKEAGDIITLAGTEGLDAHANSVRVRLQK